MSFNRCIKSLLATALLGTSIASYAEIVVGVNVSATGQSAYSGAPEGNTFRLLPETLGGEKVRYVVLNDESDPTRAAQNVRRLVFDEKVDVLVGGTLVPAGLATSQIAEESKTPYIALSPFDLSPEREHWVFHTAQSNESMVRLVMERMKADGVHTLGFLGWNDPFGEAWLKEAERLTKPLGISLVVVERYARADTSVTGQALKVAAAKPDGVLVGAAGAASALAHATLVERGYKGRVYHTHGAATPTFIKVGGRAVEGAVLGAGPLFLADQLPATHPSRKIDEQYNAAYDARFGAETRNTFGGYAYDAYRLLDAAVPNAVKRAKPGTAEFRAALRDELERTKDVVGTHGVYTMTPQNHYGHQSSSLVLMRVENGNFRLLK